MENNRTIKFALNLILGGMLLAIPFFVFAYDDKTTHPALTQEIVKFFNKNYPELKLSDSEKKLVIQGSIEEDSGIRPLRHFYDPIYNSGLIMENKDLKNPELALILGGAKSEWESAKNWAENSRLQAGPVNTAGLLRNYFSGASDYSWKRAIYEYAWGDKKRGLESLGHVLHLLEDMTVPDHTRNDPHPTGLDASPYESWTKKFNTENINIAEKLENQKPVLLPNLNYYFDELANYSNNNFFSEDTINSIKYSQPHISVESLITLSDGITYRFGQVTHKNIGEYKLVRINKNLRTRTTEYYLKDTDNLILSDYWLLLSKQAVLHGAGVIKFFFNEVEKERENKTLYNKNRSWLNKQMDKFKNGAINFAGLVLGVSENQASQTDNLTQMESQSPSKPKISENQTEISQAPIENLVKEDIDAANNAIGEPQNKPIAVLAENQSGKQATQNPISQPAKSSNSSRNQPIMGVSGKKTMPPNPPYIITEPKEENQIFTTTTVAFKGRADLKTKIGNSFSSLYELVDELQNWAFTFVSLPQGTSTIEFFSEDEDGNKSTAKQRTIFIDSIAPSVSLTISQCNQSLSLTSCLTATTTLTIEWSSSASDRDYFIVECLNGSSACSNFNFSKTTATTTSYTVPDDNSTYTFKAKAVDIYGNIGEQQSQTVEVITRPIVINEIAWAGTSAAQDQDEWIELYNPTNKAIALSGWVLRSASDNSPYIELSGTIASKGYFILERTSSTTISDITENKIYTGALVNNGEKLELSKASTTIDQTPEISACSGWCGGTNSGNYPTMERVDPDVIGADSTNWGSNNEAIKNGKNADNFAIYGTPGKRNSLNYLITSGATLSSNKILVKSKSPYLVKSGITINSGVTLTIEPGVVIKFYDTNSYITASGAIKANGTSSEKIVFTSFKDDFYGGDLNGDSSATSPQYGNWKIISLEGAGSEFDQTIIRYGGKNSIGGWANLKVKNTSATIKNSIIEESNVYGLWLDSASGAIDNNTIKNNTHDLAAVGLYVFAGSAEIKNNAFSTNTIGIQIESGNTSALTNNTFTSNTNAAIYSISSYPTFSGNSASLNGYNGVLITGSQNANYSFSNNLVYIIDATYTVLSGKELTIDAGTIIKFKDTNASLTASGKITANGTNTSNVVFTSIYDDNYGGDTSNNGSTAPAAGDWRRIVLSGSGAASSTLNYVLAKYGGSGGFGAINVANTSITLQNSTFDNNYSRGLYLDGSSLTSISGSVFKNHQEPSAGEPAGLYLKDSTPTIANTTFENNKFGIIAEGVSSVTNGGGIITFTGNTTKTVPSNLIP